MHELERNRTSLKPCRCPNCGYEFDRITHRGDKVIPPTPGDWAVCLGCAEGLVFTHDMALRKMKPEELVREALVNPRECAEFANIQLAVRDMLGRRKVH